MADERSRRAFLVKENIRLQQALQTKCENCPELIAAKETIEKMRQQIASVKTVKKDPKIKEE